MMAQIQLEGGLIETTTLVVWCCTVCAAALGAAFFVRDARRRWLVVWMGVVAACCAMRELDLHLALAPDRIGHWGVYFRIKWWLAADSPVLPRIMWAVVGVGLLALLLVPLVRARPPVMHHLRVLYPPLILLGVSAICLFTGYAMDDLLRNTPIMSIEARQMIEETSEMLGAVFFFAAVVALIRLPMPVPGQSSSS